MKLTADTKFIKHLENHNIDLEDIKNLQRKIKAYEKEITVNSSLFNKKQCKILIFIISEDI